MPARGEHVVVCDDDRWRFQIASATVAQTPDVGVLYLRQVNAYHRQVVFADGTQQVVDSASLQHAVVLFLVVDGGAARVGEVTR